MLEKTKALATIAVRDTATARRFYEGALGLKPLPSPQKGAITYESGDTNLLVYESAYPERTRRRPRPSSSATVSTGRSRISRRRA